MLKIKINTDRILGISAMMISLLTLIIFIYQTNIMRVQSKLSVKPRLSFSTSQSFTDNSVRVSGILVNKGLGPAIIDSIYLEFLGKQFVYNMEEFIEERFPKLLEVGALTRTTGLGSGSTILPGEEVVLYSYEFEPEAMDTILSVLNMENDEDDPFDFGAIYTSIYEDEHWHITSNSDNPTIIDWSK